MTARDEANEFVNNLRTETRREFQDRLAEWLYEEFWNRDEAFCKWDDLASDERSAFQLKAAHILGI